MGYLPVGAEFTEYKCTDDGFELIGEELVCELDFNGCDSMMLEMEAELEGFVATTDKSLFENGETVKATGVMF